MVNRFAKGISIVFHPVFFPTYILILLLNQDFFFAINISLRSKLILTGIVVLSTIIFPVLAIRVFKKMNLVHSFMMETKEERIYPLLVAAVFYFMSFYLLRNFPASFLFSYYMLGSVFLTLLTLILSLKIKISLHMMGIGGILGSLIGISFRLSIDLSSLIMPAIILSGIIGSARLIENAHKPSEIYSGFLAGAGVMILLFLMI